jgi:hypothetical protein
MRDERDGRAMTTAVVPRQTKKGMTGTMAPMKLLTPAATADWTALPPASVPPSSSVASTLSIASGFSASSSASWSASALSRPFS